MKYSYSEHLPVYQKRTEIIELIRSKQVVIISGDTGCGKSTQVPLFCIEAGRGHGNYKIGCTQPRRIAALSLANFLSTQFESSFRDTVGYKVRFQEKNSKETRIKFMTDGMLLAEIASDPQLHEYDTLIIDEVHERSVNIDLLLGYLKLLLQQRPQLHLILSSATIDTRLFSRFFNDAPVVNVEGRLFDVDIQYKPVIELWKGESMDSYVEGVIGSVLEIIDSKQHGDILVFLPTIDDVYDTINRLKHRITSETVSLHSLHSRISEENPNVIFERSKNRKIIIATNIAETSITVPGIRFVIDSGLARILRYDTKTAISRMPIEKISKAAANQRAGRCGRVENGVCIRLYSETDFTSRPMYTQPEIRRANCAGIILKMYQLNPHYVNRFPFLQPPAQNSMSEGYRMLRELGALDTKGKLTHQGKKMAELPLDPPVAKMLLHSMTANTFSDVSVIAAALSVDSLLLALEHNQKTKQLPFKDEKSDFISIVNLWHLVKKLKKNVFALKKFCAESGLSYLRIREWINIHGQIASFCSCDKRQIQEEISKNQYEKIHKNLLTGMYNGVAIRVEQFQYEGVTTGNIRIFPGSTLYRKNPDWILCHDIVETGQIYGHYCAEIKPRWIEELFKHQCRYFYNDPWYDPVDGFIKCKEEVQWKGLTIVKNRVVNLEYKDRKLASEVFIHDALVCEQLNSPVRFVEFNHILKCKIQSYEHKLRKRLYGGDDLLEMFYETHLSGICSRKELFREIRNRGDDSFLFAHINELLYDHCLHELDDYPDMLTIAGNKCNIDYKWVQDSDSDGISISVKNTLFETLPPYLWDWVLPVLVRKRMEIIAGIFNFNNNELSVFTEKMLEASSKPKNAFWKEIKDVLEFIGIEHDESFLQSITPKHLWPRLIITDDSTSFIKSVNTPVSRSQKINKEVYSKDIQQLLLTYECDYIKWSDPDLLKPYPIDLNENHLSVSVYPALHWESHHVKTTVYMYEEEALSSHLYALEKIVELHCEELLAWCFDSCKISPLTSQNFVKLFNVRNFEQFLSVMIVKYTIGDINFLPRSENDMDRLIEGARQRVTTAGIKSVNLIEEITRGADSVAVLLKKRMQKYQEDKYAAIHNELAAEYAWYIKCVMCEQIPVSFLEKIPTFLAAFQNRIDSVLYDSQKYYHKMMEIYEFRGQIPVFPVFSRSTYHQWKQLWNLYQLIEMYMASLFSKSSGKSSNKLTIESLKEMRFNLQSA